MAWARIDDNFFNHPKVYKAGKDAVLFHIAALCHSNAFLTEGFIEDAIINLIGKQAFQKHPVGLANKLVEVELWERVNGGYYIHDFLKYNHSKAEIEQIKSKKSYAGSLGGRPITKANQKQTESTIKANQKQTESHTQPIPIIELKEPLPPLLDAREELVGSIFKSYEHEIGMITPTVADDIKSAVEDYPLDWFGEAFKEAARNNKRNWRYALAILKRWKIEGFKVDSRTKQGNNGHKPTRSLSAGLDEILADAPIFAEDK